jgi:hypothetical protein
VLCTTAVQVARRSASSPKASGRGSHRRNTRCSFALSRAPRNMGSETRESQLLLLLCRRVLLQLHDSGQLGAVVSTGLRVKVYSSADWLGLKKEYSVEL